ncbi:MAG: hypothetical protein ACK42D_00525 [Candidatus Paceibacteria bacterium]
MNTLVRPDLIETVKIAATSGSVKIAKATTVFGDIDPGFAKLWDNKVLDRDTEDMAVGVYQVGGVVFNHLTLLDYVPDWNARLMTQGQTVTFCQKYRPVMKEGVETLFPFRVHEEGSPLVARVRKNAGLLSVKLVRLGYGQNWKAPFNSRLAVLELDR